MRDVKAEEVPAAVEKVLNAYLKNRSSPSETFLEFSSRHDESALRQMAMTDPEGGVGA